MGNPRHYVLRSKLDLHTSSLDPYRPKLHACLDLNMQAHGRCLQDQGIPFGNPNHTRDLLTDAQQRIIDRKLNMRFTVLGASNEKSIFCQSYSFNQQFKLQNDILELHVVLAKKKLHLFENYKEKPKNTDQRRY